MKLLSDFQLLCAADKQPLTENVDIIKLMDWKLKLSNWLLDAAHFLQIDDEKSMIVH